MEFPIKKIVEFKTFATVGKTGFCGWKVGAKLIKIDQIKINFQFVGSDPDFDLVIKPVSENISVLFRKFMLSGIYFSYLSSCQFLFIYSELLRELHRQIAEWKQIVRKHADWTCMASMQFDTNCWKQMQNLCNQKWYKMQD